MLIVVLSGGLRGSLRVVRGILINNIADDEVDDGEGKSADDETDAGIEDGISSFFNFFGVTS